MATTEVKKNIDDYNNVLLRPRITEKSSVRAEAGVYVFEVAERSNKIQVADAIKQIYKVTPVKINIARIPDKAVFSRGRKGVKTGGKKAFVYLKKGDKIDIM
jgi:large subunit ribosomal protein L23